MTHPQALPKTAGEFYRLRDHRTNLYAAVVLDYQTKAVRVTADSSFLNTLAGQVIFTVSANLLARWCRRVVLAVDDHALDPRVGGADSLLTAALASMTDADPFGDFTAHSDAPCDLHLHIGKNCPSTHVPTTVISAAGWYAAVGRSGEHTLGGQASNPIGAAAAAILGGAQVFRDALGREELFAGPLLFDGFGGHPVQEHTMRLIDELDCSTDLGRMLMVGAGSVGSAAGYFSRLFGIRGHLRIVDGDIVKVENFGRSPVFGKSNFADNKADTLAGATHGNGLDVASEPLLWHQAADQSLKGFDILIPVANEHGIRWVLQNAYPPLMIHAATGSNWDVNFGRHIPGVDDCLADRFEEFEKRATLKCATVELPITPTATIDASLPFLSFFAGFLIASDLARVGVAGYPHTPNCGEYSFRGKRFDPRLYNQRARRDCICRGQSKGYWHFRKSTRYSMLSPSSWDGSTSTAETVATVPDL